MTVTKLSYDVVTDPTSLGIVPERLDTLKQRISREVDAGLLPSAQLAIAKDGQLVAFETVGDATNDTRYVIFSATKPAVAAAMWLQIQDGKLDPAQKVTEFIPEFGTNGKDVITVEQVMLHTSGFPTAPMGPPAWLTREGRLKRFGDWKLNFEPGTKYVYHPTAAHWVLAEIIERLEEKDYRQVVADRVIGPMGVERLTIGAKKDTQNQTAEVMKRGEPATPDELEAVLGLRELPVTEVTDDALVGFNDPVTQELGVPGGGGVARAADVALFYQGLLHNVGGVFDKDLLADVTGKVRNSLPDYMGTPANRALGVVVAGGDDKSHLRGMGRTVSPKAFGHNGAAGQIAWGDPETGVSLAYLTNGVDADILRQGRRGVAIASLAGDLTKPL